MPQRTDVGARIERARVLLPTVHHAALATVNEDGSPHNSPVYFVIDEAREHGYWASAPEARHSGNIRRTSRAFIVIYEAGAGGGLFLEARSVHELAADELEPGLVAWNTQRKLAGRTPMDAAWFSGASPQRLYGAELARYWVNWSEKDADGNVLRDHRQAIRREDLLK